MADKLIEGVNFVASEFSPRISMIATYPIFLTSVRVSVFKNLMKSEIDGKPLKFYSAAYRHGKDLFQKFGILSLFRGVEVQLLHAYLRGQVRPVANKLKNRKLSVAMRYFGELALYPLTVACTRIVAHTSGDSKDWGLLTAWQETIKYDGIIGLWTGLFPFLIAQVYDDLSDTLIEKLQEKYPDLDATDKAVARICLAAHGAVVTAPLLSISTVMRCQSNCRELPAPESLCDVISKSVDWKSTTIQLLLVTGLCAINFALIHEKHTAIDDEEEKED